MSGAGGDARAALDAVVRGLFGACLDAARALRLGAAVRRTGREVASLRRAAAGANDPGERDRLAVDLCLATEAHAHALKALADEVNTARDFAAKQHVRLVEAAAGAARASGPLRGTTHVLALGKGRFRVAVADMDAARRSVPADLWHPPPELPEPRLKARETLARMAAGETFAGVVRLPGTAPVSLTMADAFDRRNTAKGRKQ